MFRYTALFALPLTALSLLPVAGTAHAETVGRPALMAQADPPPQLEQAVPDGQVAPEDGQVAPEEDRDDRKGKRGRKRDRDEAPPAPAADVPAEIEQQEAPPQERREKRRKSAGEAAEPPQGPPPAAAARKKRRDRDDDGPPQEEPAQSAAPVEPEPEAEKRQEQAEPREADQPQMQTEPKREPEKAAAPPPKEQPKAQPAETKRLPPQTKSHETKAPAPARDRAVSGGNMENVKKHRRQRTEAGGKRTVIEEPGNRVIVKEGGQTTIRHDETERLRRTSREVRREKRKDGTSLTIAVRPGGIEVYSVFDKEGHLERRYRRRKDGREVNLIDNRRHHGDRDRDRGRRDRDRGGIGFYLDLRPPRIGIPRNRYIVEYDNASEEDVYDALMAPPVEELDRGYTLDEIRYNRNLRDRMRRIDLDTVNFAFGSWEVAPSQYDKLSRVARAINRILDRRPDEMFLVEGHTDAVGSSIDNLTLSDRRAEEVAYILTESFNVPPENLVTQGYGEEFLKIDTQQPERANRRVAARRITPLLARR
ncbi:MAG TPA: OmpA family protein [Hyphomicrobium sp.]|jgi:outer membrane protein OmpA-like peptidoglycan-associated protein